MSERPIVEDLVCVRCGRELIRLSGDEHYIVPVTGRRDCEHAWKNKEGSSEKP